MQSPFRLDQWLALNTTCSEVDSSFLTHRLAFNFATCSTLACSSCGKSAIYALFLIPLTVTFHRAFPQLLQFSWKYRSFLALYPIDIFFAPQLCLHKAYSRTARRML